MIQKHTHTHVHSCSYHDLLPFVLYFISTKKEIIHCDFLQHISTRFCFSILYNIKILGTIYQTIAKLVEFTLNTTFRIHVLKTRMKFDWSCEVVVSCFFFLRSLQIDWGFCLLFVKVFVFCWRDIYMRLLK